MTFEERVLAVQAKFEEATNELLELVSQTPDAVSKIRRVLNPNADSPQDFEMRQEFVTEVLGEGAPALDRRALPVDGMFLSLNCQKIRDEKSYLIPSGEVWVHVQMWPEDEGYSELLRTAHLRGLSPEQRPREEQLLTSLCVPTPPQ